MSLVGFRAENHPQQVGRSGAVDDVDDRMTHPDLFDPLHARFRFTIDVAASARNTRVPRYYDKSIDGLAQSWAGESVWCNPPFSTIAPWIRKAWVEHRQARCIVMLLPANRTEQSWWQNMVEPYRDRPGSPLRVEFIRDRLRFLKPGETQVEPNNRPPFGCCLLIWQTLEWTPPTDLFSESGAA